MFFSPLERKPESLHSQDNSKCTAAKRTNALARKYYSPPSSPSNFERVIAAGNTFGPSLSYLPRASKPNGERSAREHSNKLLAYVSEKLRKNDSFLHVQFKGKDTQRSGKLRVAEVKRLLEEKGILLTERELNDLFRFMQCGMNGGFVNYEKFLKGVDCRKPQRPRSRLKDFGIRSISSRQRHARTAPSGTKRQHRIFSRPISHTKKTRCASPYHSETALTGAQSTIWDPNRTAVSGKIPHRRRSVSPIASIVGDLNNTDWDRAKGEVQHAEVKINRYTNWINSALDETTREAARLRSEVKQSIQRGRESLPRKFLFEHNLGSNKHAAEAVMAALNKIINRTLHAAFEQWAETTNHARMRQWKFDNADRIEAMKRNAANLFRALALEKEAAQKSKALMMLQRHVQVCRRRDRVHAAKLIQSCFRTFNGWWNAKKRRRQLKLQRESLSLLSSRACYFDFRGNRLRMQNKIAAVLHAKRHRAIIAIQNIVRAKLAKLYASKKKKELQQTRLRKRALEAAARRVQSAFRKKRGQFALHLRFAARRARIEMNVSSCVLIQCAWRIFCSRGKLRQLKRKADQLELCARRIQTAWRRANGKYALHLRMLARAEKAKDEKEKWRVASTRIQCFYRSRIARKWLLILKTRQQELTCKHFAAREAAARRLQAAWRRKQGQYALFVRFAARRARIDMMAESATFIQALWRRRICINAYSQMVRRNMMMGMCARRVQAAWRRSKGKYALHLRFMARRERIKHEEARRELSAIRIQALFRNRIARRVLSALRSARIEQRKFEYERQTRAATRVQIAYRRAKGNYALAVRFAARRAQLDDEKRFQELEAQSREASAVVLQSAFRTRRANVELKKRREERKQLAVENLRREAAASLIQKNFRRARGNFALHLKFCARKAQMDTELKAARMLQRVARGKIGRLRFAKVALESWKRSQREKYINEEKLRREAEAWRKQMEEDAFQRELEEMRLKAAKEHAELLKREAERVENEAREQAEKELAAWTEVYDSSGMYYYNTLTGFSQWEKPEGWVDNVMQKPPDPKSLDLLASMWEQRVDENTFEIVYVNTSTGEILKKPPPGFQSSKSASRESPEGNFCSNCFVETAELLCVQCKLQYCSSCFATLHSSRRLRHHKATPIIAKKTLYLQCHKCEQGLPHGERAVCRRWNDKVWCEPCCDAAFQVDLSRRGEVTDEEVEELESAILRFADDHPVCGVCEEDVALHRCEECTENYCDKCVRITHGKGKKQNHSLRRIPTLNKDRLEEGEEYCAECERLRATRVCDQCGDEFCDDCYDKTHSKGLRSKHTWQPFASARTGWEEFFDEEEGRYVYFNIRTKETTYEKPPELMFGAEKDAYLKREAEASRRRQLEEKVIQIRNELESLQREKELTAEAQNAEKKRKKNLRRRSKFNKFAQMVAPSLALDDEEAGNRDAGDEDSDEDDDPEVRKRARRRRRKLRAKKKKGASLFGAMMSNPASALLNPSKFRKNFVEQKKEKELFYMRKMMLSKDERQKIENQAQRSVQKKEKAREKALEAELAELRQKGREEHAQAVKEEAEQREAKMLEASPKAKLKAKYTYS